MATTEPAVTSVVIVLTILCVTRPVDTARRPVKYHSSLLSANHVRTKENCCFYTFYYIFFVASFDISFFCFRFLFVFCCCWYCFVAVVVAVNGLFSSFFLFFFLGGGVSVFFFSSVVKFQRGVAYLRTIKCCASQ